MASSFIRRRQAEADTVQADQSVSPTFLQRRELNQIGQVVVIYSNQKTNPPSLFFIRLSVFEIDKGAP